MCFGPVASFSASGFLSLIGVSVLRNVRHKKELLISFFPILFAIQQLIEGFLWLALQHEKPEALIRALSITFLGFAYALWPILCPISVYLIEYKEKRKILLKYFMVLGMIVSAYLFFFVLKNPSVADIVHHRIRYDASVKGAWFFAGLYILVTIFPYLISSQRSILLFGVPNLIFCVIAFAAYRFAFISVWCFFAALISANLYFFLKKLHHEPVLPKKLV